MCRLEWEPQQARTSPVLRVAGESTQHAVGPQKLHQTSYGGMHESLAENERRASKQKAKYCGCRHNCLENEHKCSNIMLGCP